MLIYQRGYKIPRCWWGQQEGKFHKKQFQEFHLMLKLFSLLMRGNQMMPKVSSSEKFYSSQTTTEKRVTIRQKKKIDNHKAYICMHINKD